SVVSTLALDGITPVTGIPDHGVISLSQEDGVIASAAAHRIIARSANDSVVAVAPSDDVVAITAIQHQRNSERREAVPGADRIWPTQSVDRERQRADHVHRSREARGDHPRISNY